MSDNSGPTIIPFASDAGAEAIRQQVEARKQAEADQYGGNGSGGDGQSIDSKFIRKCLNANELGDGELFKALHKDKLVFNKSMDSWMVWTGHHWQVDIMDQASAAVENVVGKYLQESGEVSTRIRKLTAQDGNESEVDRLKYLQKELIRRISALRSTRRRKNCLHFAHTSNGPIAIRGDELDRKPWLLPCKNGVLDLKTGNLRDGRPEDYLLKACPVEWKGFDEPCPILEKTLMEILSGNQKLFQFLQRLFGFALIGEVVQSIIVVLTGQGRNGKSMLVDILSEILGPLAGAIRSEMLLDQMRTSSSTGPTPDIMSLRGLRLAFASETDDGCKISPSRVKWLTGNDKLTGRNPHDKYEVQFKPTHTLFLLTNHKPHAPADDFAFWERVILVPFELSFVNRPPEAENEREADPTLPEKLRQELPGILAWLVKGCLYWQKYGLAPPPIVKQAVQEYQRDEDIIADFVEECCVVHPDAKVGATQLYTVFEKWWKINVSNKIPKQKRFGILFGKRFPKKKEGTYKYMGVGLNANAEEFMDG
jgi:putative DNA primase/helicase